jgi:hypothetical protein
MTESSPERPRKGHFLAARVDGLFTSLIFGLALDDGRQYKRFDGNGEFVLPPLKLKPD